MLNTGTEPSAPPIDGLADTPYWTNRDAVRLAELPGSLIVHRRRSDRRRDGAGVLALRRPGDPARGRRPDPRPRGARGQPAGRATSSARRASRCWPARRSRRSPTPTGSSRSRSTTRRCTPTSCWSPRAAGPTSATSGSTTVGLDPSARSVEVDERLRAGDGLWAIGDITGKGAFTHMSMYQAAIVARDILGQDGPPASYHAVPHVTFTDPEVGSVGMTEQQAREAGLNVRVGTTDLASSTRGWIAQGAGADQARRGRRPRRARRRHVGRPDRGRGAVDAGDGGARRGADRHAALDDLRLPDVPPGRRVRALQAWVLAAVARCSDSHWPDVQTGRRTPDGSWTRGSTGVTLVVDWPGPRHLRGRERGRAADMSEDLGRPAPALHDVHLPRQAGRPAPTDVELFVYRPRGWSVVEIDGELDVRCVPRLREVLARAGSRVVLDLSGVTFIDASGLGVLAAAADRARGAAAPSRAGASRQASWLVVLTRLDRVLPLVITAGGADDEGAGPCPTRLVRGTRPPEPGVARVRPFQQRADPEVGDHCGVLLRGRARGSWSAR